MAHEDYTTLRSAGWQEDKDAESLTAAMADPILVAPSAMASESDPWSRPARAHGHDHSAIEIHEIAVTDARHACQPIHHTDASARSGEAAVLPQWHNGAGAEAGTPAHASGAHGARWWWQAVGSLAALYASVLVAPLFVLPAVFAHSQTAGPPTRDDLIGALSLIVWSLAAIGGLKYSTIVFAEDADGEGGLFALLTLIRRGMAQYERDHPRLQQAKRAYESERPSPSAAPGLAAAEEDHATAASSRPRLDTRSWSRSQRLGAYLFVRLHLLVLLLTFVGICMSACAGYLGPAVSVLSVAEALVAVQPSFEPQLLMLVMLSIKIVLVSLHVRTERLRRSFAPIMLAWTVIMAVVGVANIAREPAVLEALSPHHALRFLNRSGDRLWPHLGGVLLCVAGLLTAHANMGRVGPRTARTAWWLLVFPSLALAYAGQAASLMDDPDPSRARHTFFATLPTGLYYPMLLFATVAAMIAANALFMGVFELVSAGGKLGILPRFAITHKDGPGGPLLLPVVAALMAFGAMTTVHTFTDSLLIANAYSTATSVVFAVASLLLALALFFHRRMPGWMAVGFACLCLFVDGGFLAANIYSLQSCAYFPLIFTHVMWQALGIYQWGITQRRLFARRGGPKVSGLAQADLLSHLLPQPGHIPDAQRQEELALLQVLTASAPQTDREAATAKTAPLSLLSACSSPSLPLGSEPSTDLPQISAMASIGVFVASDNEYVPRAAWQLLERQRSFPARAVFLRFECTENPREDADAHVQVRAVYTPAIERDWLRDSGHAAGDPSAPVASAAAVAQHHLNRFEVYTAVVRSGFTEHRVCMASVMRRLCDQIDFLERAGVARHFDPAAANATSSSADLGRLNQQSGAAAGEAAASPTPSLSDSAAVPMSASYEQLAQADLNPFEIAMTSPSDQSDQSPSESISGAAATDQCDDHLHLPLTYYVRSETLLAPSQDDKPTAPAQSSRDPAAVPATTPGSGVSGPGSRVSVAHSRHRARVALRGIFAMVYNKVQSLDSVVAHFQIPREQVVDMSAQIAME